MLTFACCKTTTTLPPVIDIHTENESCCLEIDDVGIVGRIMETDVDYYIYLRERRLSI